MSGAAPDTQCISIDIVDDTDFEENQHFSVSISNTVPPFNPTMELATVVIQDNNGQLLLF